ncbi:DEAD/DEAH box helicase [Sphingobium sp. AP49]|uniref:DEAD/DEAH box helicase n=1 Tax=Sphingobium sp. AP49 TaxID=1144307 RepID=UPI00026EE7CD|nr:DEAD/DEAH box helicase [Sphingobium sp. AP49]WHO40683.1 DEAD/DEAH box helicase [Sphingobium sp. AP49]
MTFADLGLSDELLKAVNEAGYDTPTPIQAQAIPPVLMMKDIIGIAQTGTGKTASFVLPMIDILAHGRARALMPRSLILEPTRELAAQVAENFEKYGKYHKLSMALLIGGVQMGDQIKALEKGVDVLIATPGRLMDLFQRGKILLNGCNMLVIDEADRMLDMGFIPDIEEICTKLPTQRQTLLFSATMPPVIKKLADRFLDNPKSIEVARPATASTNITQHLVKVDSRKKREALRAMLAAEDVTSAVIFCNRKTTVRELNKSLQRYGFKSGEIHGDIDQSSRIAELERFRDGTVNILVASDVAARGLDIKGVSHVFNFDAPWHPDDYVHRIGRTGRAGAKGVAYTFVTSEDAEAIDNIQKLIGTKINYVDSPDASAPAATGEGEARKSERGGRDSRRKADKSKEIRAEVRASDEPRKDAGRKEPRRDEGRDPPAAAVRQASKPRLQEPDDGPDDGWNGPMPEFLNFGFNA